MKSQEEVQALLQTALARAGEAPVRARVKLVLAVQQVAVLMLEGLQAEGLSPNLQEQVEKVLQLAEKIKTDWTLVEKMLEERS